MSNENDQNDRKKEKTFTVEEVRDMISEVAYNPLGYDPSECEWHIVEKDVIRDANNFAKSKISNVEGVTVIPDIKNNSAFVVVWFNKRCKHFYNTEFEKTALRRGNAEYSKELRDFVSRYGDRKCSNNGKAPKVDQCLAPALNGDRNLIGIKIDMLFVYQVGFDSNNVEYSRLFNTAQRKSNVLRLMWKFNDTSHNRSIEYLIVRKESNTKTKNSKGLPTAIAGMKA